MSVHLGNSRKTRRPARMVFCWQKTTGGDFVHYVTSFTRAHTGIGKRP
jgi:hypothetical protein